MTGWNCDEIDRQRGVTGVVPDCCMGCGEDHGPEDETTRAETGQRGEINAQIQGHKKTGNPLYTLIWELQGKVHGCDHDAERDELLLAQQLCIDFYKELGGYEMCKLPEPQPRFSFWRFFSIGVIVAVIGYYLWPCLYGHPVAPIRRSWLVLAHW